MVVSMEHNKYINSTIDSRTRDSVFHNFVYNQVEVCQG
jgi:hypothetical protein